MRFFPDRDSVSSFMVLTPPIVGAFAVAVVGAGAVPMSMMLYRRLAGVYAAVDGGANTFPPFPCVNCCSDGRDCGVWIGVVVSELALD